MSKTFSYIILVIMVYLLIIFPKMISKSGEENESSIEKSETTIRAGYTA